MSERDERAAASPNDPSGMPDGNATRGSQESPVHIVPRRRVLGAGVGVGLGMTGIGANAASPARMRPQPGDLLVVRFGGDAGQPVSPDDVPSGAELMQVVPKDPKSGTIRDGSRLNGINLVRIDASSLDAEAREYAAGGIIAFSSVCTHQGCDLTQWLPDETMFECYCHHSKFDASSQGKPQHGPAKRRLAMLPLRVNGNGHLEAAGKFTGKVGFK